MLVSVIIPTYNSKERLRQLLESLRCQTFANMEIIVIDDGGFDGTDELVQNMRECDARISYYWQENSGVSVARNTGLDISRGDIVMFSDADDTFPEHALESIVQFMTDHEVDICFGAPVVHRGAEMAPCYGLNTTANVITKPADMNRVMSCCLDGQGFTNGKHTMQFSGSVWAKGYSKRFLDRNGLRFDPNLPRAQDIEFVLRAVSAAQSIGNLHKPVYDYVVASGTLSHKYNCQLAEQFARMLSRVRNTVTVRECARLDNDYCYFAMNCAVEAARRMSFSKKEFCQNLHLVCDETIYAEAIDRMRMRSLLRIKENVKAFVLKHRIQKFYQIMY